MPMAWVEPVKAFELDMNGLKIPVYHSYNDGEFSDQLLNYYQLDIAENMGDIDVRDFGNGNKESHKEILTRALEAGQLDEYMPEELLEQVQAVRSGKLVINGTHKMPDLDSILDPGNVNLYIRDIDRLKAELEKMVSQKTGFEVKLEIGTDPDFGGFLGILFNENGLNPEQIEALESLGYDSDAPDSNATQMLAELFGVSIVAADGWGAGETIHAIELTVDYKDYFKAIFPKKYSAVHVNPDKEISPEQMAALNVLAEKCINSMGDIFYDPEGFGDYNWGIDDDGNQTVEGETANERLKNRAVQCVCKTLAEGISIYNPQPTAVSATLQEDNQLGEVHYTLVNTAYAGPYGIHPVCYGDGGVTKDLRDVILEMANLRPGEGSGHAVVPVKVEQIPPNSLFKAEELFNQLNEDGYGPEEALSLMKKISEYIEGAWITSLNKLRLIFKYLLFS